MDDERHLDVPRELEAGAYADWLNAWHTRHELVLDFGAWATEDALVATARVRIPSSAALDVLHSFEDCIRGYELQFGEIHRPRRRGEA